MANFGAFANEEEVGIGEIRSFLYRGILKLE